jgi:integrase
MLFRLVRPMRRSGSRNVYFVQRIPTDLKTRATGLKLNLPIGNETVPFAISRKANFVKVSLRTSDPSEGKVRHATTAGYLETVWQALREDAPIPLTNREATALAGRLYSAWASGEGRERTTSVIVMRDGSGRASDHESADNIPEFWESAKRHLDAVETDDEAYQTKAARGELNAKDTIRPLERTFGPIIDRLLLHEGIRRVDTSSRELLLKAFRLALTDAFALRERNARGDYRPDENAERFPEFQRANAKPAPSPSRKGDAKETLTGLVEDWWKEAKAGGRTISTYEGYRNTMRQLVAFLRHDNASRITAGDVIGFKDHRVAQGISLKTVRDSDIAALRSVFGWAVANRRITSNPTDGVKLKSAKVVRTRSKGFSVEEATALLGHALHYAPSNRENPKTTAAKRWAPWLCAYTGARVGEIVQLRKQDVRFADGDWIITITPEAGTVKDKEAREVVLHPHLVELGFADFVQRSKPGYLFLNAGSGDDIRGVWRAVKNRLTDFAREVVKDLKVAPNHGWRHTFKTIGREAGIEDSVLDAICGHAPKTVGGAYGGVSIAAQQRAFERFPRFDLGDQSNLCGAVPPRRKPIVLGRQADQMARHKPQINLK